MIQQSGSMPENVNMMSERYKLVINVETRAVRFVQTYLSSSNTIFLFDTNAVVSSDYLVVLDAAGVGGWFKCACARGICRC
jgi:hypothetical protein